MTIPDRSRMRVTIAAVSCLLLAMLATACSRAPDSPVSDITAPESVLRRGNGGDPQSLDPALAEDVHAFNVLADLYEGLVIESGDGSLVPGAAERWEVSPDGLRYTFYLRQDAVWSNGQPVSADDFVAAFRRVLSPASTSAYAFLLEPIRNYDAVMNADLTSDELGVHAADAKTLQIELSAPARHFPRILAMPIAFPVYAADGDDALRFRDPEHFVGNGPYVLQQWSVGEKIRLKKNPYYRNVSDVAIDAVEYLPITDPHTELNMFRAAELDITNTVPPDAIDRLRSERSDELHIAPSLGLYYLAFDLSEAPLDNVLLRQALTMAIDRQTLVSVLGRGEAAAFGVVPPGVAGHDGARFAWQDLDSADREKEARALYKQAGYGEASPLSLKLSYDVGDIHETVALVVSSMWRDVLGIDVELEKQEWKFFLATRGDRSAWQVMRFAWVGDYNDATTFTDIFRSNSPQNLPHYQSAAYDALLDSASQTPDTEARAARLHDAEALLLRDYPIAPLYFFVSKHMVSERVLGFQDNVLDRHPSRFLRLASDR